MITSFPVPDRNLEIPMHALLCSETPLANNLSQEKQRIYIHAYLKVEEKKK